MQTGRTIQKARLESYHCECRGPEAPHDHYFVRWDDLKKGDQVVVRRDEKKAGRYILQLKSAVGQKGLCG